MTTNAPLVLVGHSHVALAIGLDDSELHGGLAAGGHGGRARRAAGCSTPARSASRATATRDAAWLELDTDARFARFHRVAYPIERTQAAMREQGLPEPLATRLAHGI